MFLDLNRIPVLETHRLVLRGFRDQDMAPFTAMLANPRVGRFKGFPEGASGAQSWGGMVNILGHWALKGFGLFAVELRETTDFVGCVGVIEPPGWPGPEMSWTLREEYWGRGLATEAAMAVRDWAFPVLGVARLVSLIHADNTASVGVVRRLGGVHERDIRWFGETVGLYAISAGSP
jgi:RimJ/RimL family protein N-acetyltransferase